MFFDMSHLLRDRVAPRTLRNVRPPSAARKTHTNPATGQPRGAATAPTRVLSRSFEGELRADVLRQMFEEVAISFSLPLWTGHVPGPRLHYSVRGPNDNRNTAGPTARRAHYDASNRPV